MLVDFSKVPLKNRAFSDKPMTFIDPVARNFFAAVVDLIAIETGNRGAREHWQRRQLQNLLQHAAQKSAFWRQRVGSRNIKDIRLSDLPVLTRSDVMKQVSTEGNLLALNPTIAAQKHATSGSSGTPVQFFVSDMNAQYNVARSLAQYFMEGLDLTVNRTRFYRAPKSIENGFSVEKTEQALGPLSSLFKCGSAKDILHHHLNRDLVLKELAKDPIGYLVVQPSIVESLFYNSDLSFLAEHGTKMLIPTDEEADEGLRARCAAAGIPVRAVYSSFEAGYIAAECADCPGCFHVAQSNVIIEIDERDSVVVAGTRLGRVLITHLHSYATPFVRYDIGDLAQLSETCACGHDGPVLRNIYGRKKRLLKHADGTVTPFAVVARNILQIVACDEYRIRQTDLKTIEVEIAMATQLSADKIAALVRLVKDRAGDEFEIRIKPVAKIDWGADTKRLGFRNDLL